MYILKETMAYLLVFQGKGEAFQKEEILNPAVRNKTTDLCTLGFRDCVFQ
jgi:hypothetical protein